MAESTLSTLRTAIQLANEQLKSGRSMPGNVIRDAANLAANVMQWASGPEQDGQL